MSKNLVDLAIEIADSRDLELPSKLVKIKDLLYSSDSDPQKIKTEIYKYDLLEALSVSLKHEYELIRDGWKLSVELVKIFCLCTTDFGPKDKNYQNILLPNTVENSLILAKKIQDKYIKSKAYSNEFLDLFRDLMKEYVKINKNNSFIALKSLKSQRLFQLLLTDEQNTSAIIMNTYKELFLIKRNLLSQLGEKALYLILDEIIYKMVVSEIKDTGIAIFQLLNTICHLDPNLIRQITKRYKGIKILTEKWKSRDIDKELNEFLSSWDGATRVNLSNRDMDNNAIIIQKVWRGYKERKRLREANKSFARFQRRYRLRRAELDEEKLKKMAQDELRFQLLLEHRRKQRQRKVEMMQIIEILPSNQIEKYLEKQREYSAKVIQSNYRGYKIRKDFKQNKDRLIQTKAIIRIQRAVRKWLESIRKRRQQPAFYSRPPGLDSEKREALFDKIRKHLDSLPPHPRTEKDLNELHDKAQRMFHDYVINQQSVRKQQQKIQVLLAFANSDADILLNCPKLSQVTEEEINNYYAHKSTPVMLAAKQAHKRMLRKQRAKWYEKLMDDTDSENDDEENYDEKFDELNNNLRNLNFNSATDNYFKENSNDMAAVSHSKSARSRSNLTTTSHNSNTYFLHHGIPKREKNQLKTNNLRQTFTKMMSQTPTQSRIWNVDPIQPTPSFQK